MNFFFIAFYQNLLLWLLVLPAYLAASAEAQPWSNIDTVAVTLFLVFVLGETLADQQQWDFHSR